MSDMQSPSFQMNKDAAEFTPNASSASFAFNPSACEFQPNTPSTQSGGKSPDGIVRQPDSSPVHHPQPPPQHVAAPAYMTAMPVPVAVGNLNQIYPCVVAVQTPVGQPGIRPGQITYMAPHMQVAAAAGPGFSMGNAPAAGAPYGGHEAQGSRQGGAKGNVGGKGNSHRGHQGTYAQNTANNRNQNWNGRKGGSGGQQPLERQQSSGSGAQHSPEDEAKGEQESAKEKEGDDETKEEKAEEEAEEDKGPKKPSWADRLKAGIPKTAEAETAAPKAAIPKRVAKRPPAPTVPQVAAPKPISWGPAGKSEPAAEEAAPAEATAAVAPAQENSALEAAAKVEEAPPAKEAGPTSKEEPAAPPSETVPVELEAEGAEEVPRMKADEAIVASSEDVPAVVEASVEADVQGTLALAGANTTPAVAETQKAVDSAPQQQTLEEPQEPPAAAPESAAQAPEAEAAAEEAEESPKKREPPSWADRLFKKSASSPVPGPGAKAPAGGPRRPQPQQSPAIGASAASPEKRPASAAAAPVAAAAAPTVAPEIHTTKEDDCEATCQEVEAPPTESAADDAAGTNGARGGEDAVATGLEEDVECNKEDEANEEKTECRNEDAATALEGGADAGAGVEKIDKDAEEEEENEEEAAEEETSTNEKVEGKEQPQDEETGEGEGEEGDGEEEEEEDKEDEDEIDGEGDHLDDTGDHEDAEMRNRGGGADAAAGSDVPIRYSVEFLKSLREAPGSVGSCPPNVPAQLRKTEGDQSEEQRAVATESGKRRDLPKQFKDKPAGQEMNRSAPTSPTQKQSRNTADERSPVAEDECDWRAMQVKHQASMKARDKDRSAKGGGRGRRGGREDDEHDRVKEPPPKLAAASETSWALQQKAAKQDEDARVIREMKSILNKLTVEKFDTLYQKLLDCGIETTTHIECLMREVFEKATTQHHFIEMYTTLCVRISEWSNERDAKRKESDKENVSFKRILLNQCQDSFEKYLKPPEGLQELDGDERFQAVVKYKTRMLGNMKFVAQLLINKMLSSKIIFQCVDELFQVSSEEALETLCAFLCAIGPGFDVEGWKLSSMFVTTFGRVQEVCNDPSTPQRIRCLLKDVLDYRASGWKRKARAQNETDGPKRMEEVREQWKKDNTEKDRKSAPTPSKGDNDEWETVPRRGGDRPERNERGGDRGDRGSGGGDRGPQITRAGSSQLPGRDREHGNVGGDRPQRASRKPKESAWGRSGTAPELRSGGASAPGSANVTPAATPSNAKSLTSFTAESMLSMRLGPSTSMRLGPSATTGDSTTAAAANLAASEKRSAEDSRKELLSAINELASSHDLDGAVTRVREVAPKKGQEAALVEKAIPVCLQKSDSARPILWKFLSCLVKEGIFPLDALAEGVEKFISSANYIELFIDLPKLPGIIRDELAPAMQNEAGISAQQVGKLLELEATARAQADEAEE